MGGYTKLFSEILTSSIWNEDDKTRIVWITLLALADMRGLVMCAKSSLAVMARVKNEDCQRAIERLESPDAESKNPANEGRRIQPVEGGWLILNYEKYRNKLSTDKETVQARERMKKMRNKGVTLRNPVVVVASASGYEMGIVKGGGKPDHEIERQALEAWLNTTFGRPRGSHWTGEEQYNLVQLSLRPGVTDELKLVAAYWKRAKQRQDKLPMSVGRVMAAWTDLLDRTRCAGVQEAGRVPPKKRLLDPAAVDDVIDRLDRAKAEEKLSPTAVTDAMKACRNLYGKQEVDTGIETWQVRQRIAAMPKVGGLK